MELTCYNESARPQVSLSIGARFALLVKPLALFECLVFRPVDAADTAITFRGELHSVELSSEPGESASRCELVAGLQPGEVVVVVMRESVGFLSIVLEVHH